MDPKVFDEIFGDKCENDENFYSILGCDPSSTVSFDLLVFTFLFIFNFMLDFHISQKEQILAEYKAKARELHPDKGSQNDSKQFLLLQKAKEILTDDKSRSDYDRWRCSGLRISYKRWSQMNAEGLHSSFHWSSISKQTKPAIKDGENTAEETQKPRSVWKSTEKGQNSMLDRFRNYEI